MRFKPRCDIVTSAICWTIVGYIMCGLGRCTSTRRRTGTGHVFLSQRVRILESCQCENDYELRRDGASYVHLTCLERTCPRISFVYSLVSCRRRSTTRRLPVLFLPPFASVESGVCYNEQMLQRRVFINKIRMLQRTQMLQRTRRKGILSADVARACAWRVGPSRFD
jgi:hypothetical protein